MTHWFSVALSAAVALGVASWWYGRREEKVRGRGLAAVLRGASLFLLLAAPWMPSLTAGSDRSSGTAILVDRSASMSYPSGSVSGRSRLAAARDTAEALLSGRPADLWTFGGTTRTVARAELDTISAVGKESLVARAIRRARAAGSDTIIVVTDGELTDRETARREAELVGLTVREVRVARPVARAAIRSVRSPGLVRAGDTLEITAFLVASGRSGDSATVRLEFGADRTATEAVELPGAGREAEVSLRVPVDAEGDSLAWHAADVRVEGVSAPWDAAASARVWVGVTPEPVGAVMVSTDPDWEPRYLAPVLQRVVPGGARVFLRVGDGEWVRAGGSPAGTIPEAIVRRAAGAATLLVIQGQPAELPEWLVAAARRRSAILVLTRGPGAVPGTGVSAREALDGDWYAAAPPPPGPVSADLLGTDPSDQPPLTRLYGSAEAVDGAVLSARHDRRGAERPLASLGSAGARRWAVVYGEGTWRWAARGGDGLSLYRGLYAGMTRWLLENAAPRPVLLADTFLRSGDSIRWRVAPDVRDLTIRIERDSGGEEWSSVFARPPAVVSAPPPGVGGARFVAAGTAGDDAFRIERPFHVNAGVEELPAPVGPPLDLSAEAAEDDRVGTDSELPVWPFGVAILLLCGEWIWRRRVGLR